jgi:hypothetical protein
LGIPGAEKEGDPHSRALQLIDRGLLASAQALLVAYHIAVDVPALTARIEDCRKRGAARKKDGDIRASIGYQRRAAALAMMRDTGCLSGAVMPPVILPDGYCGKIMLISVKGDAIPARTCLRSGDDWHREIVRNFESEVRDFGFEKFQISPRGGAFAEFDSDEAIVLSGSSEEFGRCRKEDALQLIQAAFPQRNIYWSATADM